MALTVSGTYDNRQAAVRGAVAVHDDERRWLSAGGASLGATPCTMNTRPSLVPDTAANWARGTIQRKDND